MPGIGNDQATLVDVARRMGPNGGIQMIAEVLTRVNEILLDMPFYEGNLSTGNVCTQRTTEPTGSYRRLNEGVSKEKSTTEQITDATAMLESYSNVDVNIVDKAVGSKLAFRLSEDKSFARGMAKTFATTLMYGNELVNAERFTGFSPRYDSTSTDEDNRDFNVVDGAGAGSDNTSVWLVVWGQETCHGIYPRNSKAGFQMRDRGEQTVLDDNGKQYQAYVTHFKWDQGLVIKDWRYVARLANIDVSDLAGGSAANLVNLLIDLESKVPDLGSGKAVLYANNTILTYLRKQIIAKSNVNLNFDNVAGKRVMTFDGIPFRRVDAILNTESHVT